MQCFNHCVNLTVKCTLKTTSFGEIDLMLHKLYYLYQKCPKRISELGEFSEDYGKTQYLNSVKQQEHAG